MNTRMGLIAFTVLSTLFGVSCQPIPQTYPQEQDRDAEEYVIYNDLLKSHFEGDEIDQVLIIDHTRVSNYQLMEQDLAAFQEFSPMAPELIASFRERNQQSFPISPILEFGVGYQLLTQEEVDALRPLDEASGWNLFNERYPNSYGFVYLSRAGFNGDTSQALIYMESLRYDQLIKGGYYLLIRQNGRWVVKNEYEWMP